MYCCSQDDLPRDCCRDGRCTLCVVRQNVSGKDAVFTGPFGPKKVIYCDYTASGKPLDIIESFIQDYVHPFYANTHTSCNVTGKQTSEFREEAREIIKSCVNASDEDVVIFTGNGTSGAIHKLVSVLQLDGPKAKHTVVMTGPFEHHSNILPWKEKRVEFVRIGQTKTGLLDLKDLERRLKRYSAQRYNIVVALSAASNVTGITTDTKTVTELVHAYGGLSVWDYAAGGPYLKIDMNPTKLGAKDAVYLSPHKFVGGPSTPGLLIAKKKLFANAVPHGCGGGTVVYVTRETHRYHDNIEEREEGGTPAIVDCIRAGLVFKLKKEIGEDLIAEKEEESCKEVFFQLDGHPGISILGSPRLHRLPIFSLLFYSPEGAKYLHHNFVSVLLNDLYGIQIRSGCACAGPYAMDLLHMDEKTATRFATLLTDGWCCGKMKHKKKGKGTCSRSCHTALGIMKPGFSRFNVPFFMGKSTLDYLLHGIDMVATHGWKLLPLYRYDVASGEWHHRKHPELEVNTLHDLRITGSRVSMPAPLKKSSRLFLEDMKALATVTFQTAETLCQDVDCSQDPEIELGPHYEELRWFLLPQEAKQLLAMPAESRPYTLYPDASLPFKVPVAHSDDKGPDSAYCSNQSINAIPNAATARSSKKHLERDDARLRRLHGLFSSSESALNHTTLFPPTGMDYAISGIRYAGKLRNEASPDSCLSLDSQHSGLTEGHDNVHSGLTEGHDNVLSGLAKSLPVRRLSVSHQELDTAGIKRRNKHGGRGRDGCVIS